MILNIVSGKSSDLEKKAITPIISVIVPIYNVAPYLRRCLDSLKNQSFKQIEVICIDDGSTDTSGVIADEYANENEWPLFKVVHNKDNRGLSATRNIGIDISCGDWLMFVDSDDWVDKEFCRLPFEAALKENADMVIVSGEMIRRCKKTKIIDTDAPAGVIDEFSAHEYGTMLAWNKLYHKKLFASIRYPEKRTYEDVATTHEFVHEAKKIVLLKDSLYHHIKRRGSITETHTAQYKYDNLIFSLKRKENLVSYGFPEKKMEDSLCGPAIAYIACNRSDAGELYDKAVEILNTTGRMPRNLSYKEKVAFWLWKNNRRLFFLLRRTIPVKNRSL